MGLMISSQSLVGTLMAEPNQDFTLVNRTGYVIDQVFVSPAHSDDWENDVLGRDIMDDGESVPIQFSRGTTTCEWDLKVVYEVDGSSAVWHDIDLCSVSKISIFWNQSSGKTTARYE
ncbi:MAG: argininosuccinate lyase [Magnetococcales bacterium]|nr:argininosuccinate lyase [Magnetococcales bacterium]